MSKKNEVYLCKECGLTVLTIGETGSLDKCNSGLELLIENSTEAAVEKHIPVVEKISGGFKVSVGSIIHPSTEEHFIEWIKIDDGDVVQIKFLEPGKEPIAEFKSSSNSVVAYAYCNLHGLWTNK